MFLDGRDAADLLVVGVSLVRRRDQALGLLDPNSFNAHSRKCPSSSVYFPFCPATGNTASGSTKPPFFTDATMRR